MQRFSAIELDGLPDRFTIFRPGENRSTKGSALFDDGSGKSVLSRFEEHGVDLMIDLEHLSLDPSIEAYNPDAMGWIGDLVVENGALVAANVTWTPEGAARLRDKKQRYISPCFLTDAEGRVTEILNVALTAMPATHDITALIAANRVAKGLKMEELIDALAEMLGLSDDEKTPEKILEKIRAMMETRASDEEDEVQNRIPEPHGDGGSEEMSALSNVVSSVVEEVEALKRGQERAAVDSLIRDNIDKIPPALESWARSLSVVALSAFLKNAPAVHPETATEPSNGIVELTPHEIKWARILGTDPEKLRELKNGQA